MAVQYFVAADYCVLVVVLGISSAIGVFFAWKDRRSTNNKEFLIGNRKLQLFPVTMSMIASFLSAIAMLGVPAENFVHGSQYLMNTVGVVVGIVLSAEVFMPVFYDMEMISVNQYLEKRFNSVVLRKFASALSIIQTCFYLGVVLYGPSLALGSVTGLPVWLSIIVNGSVCAFYTTIGGIKAVVWTDVMQLLLMVTGFLVVTIQACMMLGGVSPVFTIADQQGILEFFDTMSSGYNALAAITWEDFLKPILHLSPSGVMRATKIIAASYGVLAILVAFLSGTIPSILQATFITSGAVGGASGAVFFIGLLLPWCGSKTALASMITGMCTASWVAIGSLIYPKRPA
ncbi:sodium-dependent multivitamin transporter, putative [Ixodes scapularis]|uniref:Sodium-dependent multivitamin transporter, putative n=1 Tax=Ixodes scapularis TaxID=6945 RepID=B7PQ82_IXOSC|nr:sodium-dependent multivitamin transporter, putative [Ixodes scapularis]|eukprot:XP_002435924.1 sodium-dependent multivitamin transporter, putative [Ixodes scapularis]